MFPEDAKNMLIVYEPVEGMSNESKNWKKRQLGYIHKACLEKAGSKNNMSDDSVSGVV